MRFNYLQSNCVKSRESRHGEGHGASSSSAAYSSADDLLSPSTSVVDCSSALSMPVLPAWRTPDPGAAWSPVFYAEFTSCVWPTYHSRLS